jgi:hypothetical protein
MRRRRWRIHRDALLAIPAAGFGIALIFLEVEERRTADIMGFCLILASICWVVLIRELRP